jgi:hypothetical protein
MVTRPITTIEVGMLHPATSARGIALAKTRTASPRKRVTRNTVDVSRRVPTPKRDSSLA